jgi:NAD(P)-dependent dehydrogenase (short-subunit alcohol dehydrogenase family)/uncharacterized protein YndB with AHSA1/START domain
VQEIRFTGEVALITGGGRGLGRAFARKLAASGAAVAVLARSPGELAGTVTLIQQTGGSALAIVADVTKEDEIQAALTQVEQTLGHITLLVNNAATIGPIGPFSQTELNEWWEAMNVNLRGPVLCARAVLPGMISRRRGRIINVSSGGDGLVLPYLSAYMTSKAALSYFTASLASETRALGIVVFALGPGTVSTTMSQFSVHSPEGQKWLSWFGRIFDEGRDVPADRAADLLLTMASGKIDALSGKYIRISDDIETLMKLGKQEPGAPWWHNPDNLIRPACDTRLHPTLRIHRAFQATRENVFQLWTNPEAIRNWFIHGTEAVWIAPPQVQARSGGEFHYSLRSGEKDFHLSGTFHEMRELERLVFSWHWENLHIIEAPGDTVVMLEFLDRGSRTEIILTQTGFASEVARDAHRAGWARCFDGIAALLDAEGNDHARTRNPHLL